MPTDCGSAKDIALFLFAHQDDEFGVFEQILLEQRMGRRVEVGYLTTGVRTEQNPERRNRESLAVLIGLGVHSQDIHFVGESLGISDGTLSEKMVAAADWLAHRIMNGGVVASLYVPAWEGGHPDHDSLCAVAATVGSQLQCGDRLRQFHLYNSFGRRGPFFSVLSPLQENGSILRSSIPWRHRLRYLGYCLYAYPSQWRSWLGLFPFVLIHYVLRGCQEVQPVPVDRIGVRPHEGELYYEKRRFSTWNELHSRIVRFQADWCTQTLGLKR